MFAFSQIIAAGGKITEVTDQMEKDSKVEDTSQSAED